MRQKISLAAMRKARDVSQKELAAELNVHRVHLCYVENGKRESKALTERAVEFLMRRHLKKM